MESGYEKVNPFFRMKIDTRHGIMFLADSSNGVSCPENVDDAFVVPKAKCLSFRVLTFTDGASEVTISNERPDRMGGRKRFSGTIKAPSGTLELQDSSVFAYIRVPVKPGPVGVEIWSDHLEWPAWVWVRLDGIKPI